MHPACSKQCQVKHGVRPFPSRFAFRDQFGALWLVRDEEFSDLAARVFPEFFTGRTAQMVKLKAGVLK